MIINPVEKMLPDSLKIYNRNTFCIIIENKIIFLVCIAITGIFIMASLLFNSYQTLNIQKVNAQYNRDGSNNNNSISSKIKQSTLKSLLI